MGKMINAYKVLVKTRREMKLGRSSRGVIKIDLRYYDERVGLQIGFIWLR